nr:M56 family metallopeptidase [uncultured Agathobaculum sp.]
MTGNELLLSLVQIGLTVSAAALALFLLRRALKKRYPARAICAVWAILAIRLLIPVQLTLPDPPVQLTPPARTLYVTYHRADTPQAANPSGTAPQQTAPHGEWMSESEFESKAVNANGVWMNAIHIDGVLVLVWLIGALYSALRQWTRYHRFYRALNRPSAHAQRDTLRRVFEEQKHALGIRRHIPLIVTPAADCPMLAGYARPALYLPDEALSEQQAMFIFRHELTHYKRHDLWLKLILVAAQAVHWFNPLVHLMARFAREDIELACDDAVVRGMDGAQRRAYGETILQSAAAQVKKRALVSCFAGDKDALMRRFEGLFDMRAKKRGVALITAAAILIVSLGCAVSVGENQEELDEQTVLSAAQEYAQAVQQGNVQRAYEMWSQRMRQAAGITVPTEMELPESGITAYALTYEPEDQTCVLVSEQQPGERQAVRLWFTKEDGAVKVDDFTLLLDTEDVVDSLDDFRILYENDLGLPDFLTRTEYEDWNLPMMDISSPDRAAIHLLRLDTTQTASRSSPDSAAGDDIVYVTCMFADGNEVTITMLSQFGAGWLPQDFTYDGGVNDRTAADLAQQYARGVTHKSGQFIYPILSAQKQQDFITQQRMGESGGINWRYGTSSPSYRDFALVPTSENSYIVVFQMYGGGANDYREAYVIETASADGRSIIWDVRQVGRTDEMTYHNLFDLYYNSGLAWPVLDNGMNESVGSAYNGVPVAELAQPETAAQAVFGYFAEPVEYTEGNAHFVSRTPVFTAELVSQTGSTAAVRLIFTDGSPSTEVRMEQTEDYWMPVGIAATYDEAFFATAQSGSEIVFIPAGWDVSNALSLAEVSDGVPQLADGDIITMHFGARPAGEVILTERDIYIADGTPRYDERLVMETVLPHSETGEYTYTVSPSMGYYLSSQYPDTIYRAVTADYEDEDGVLRTVTFVFYTANGDARTDYTLTSNTYYNSVYGYTLTLPDCFVEQGYVKEQDGMVTFGLKDAWPGVYADPTEAGVVMSLAVGSVAELRDVFGENWAENYYVPCKELAVQNGLAYLLLFASDVQYDTTNTQITAAYTEMYAAAEGIAADAISFDGQSDQQRANERETALQELATYYISRAYYIGDAAVLPDAAENTCTVVWAGDPGGAPDAASQPRRAERLWFDDLNSVHPSRTEMLADSGAGVHSLDAFLMLYDNSLALPELPEYTVRLLLENTAITALRDPVQAAEWLLGLSGGTASDWRANAQRNEEIFLYTWPDGSQVYLVMKAVQLGGAAQPIYLPIRWDAGAQGGTGWAYDPYSYMMCKEQNDFSGCTAEELAYYLGESDGAYTENILHELNLRWREDPAGIDQLMESQQAPVRSLWENHKAANPDIFP